MHVVIVRLGVRRVHPGPHLPRRPATSQACPAATSRFVAAAQVLVVEPVSLQDPWGPHRNPRIIATARRDLPWKSTPTSTRLAILSAPPSPVASGPVAVDFPTTEGAAIWRSAHPSSAARLQCATFQVATSMAWDLIGACVPRLTTVWNLTEPPLRYRWFRPLFRFHRPSGRPAPHSARR